MTPAIFSSTSAVQWIHCFHIETPTSFQRSHTILTNGNNLLKLNPGATVNFRIDSFFSWIGISKRANVWDKLQEFKLQTVQFDPLQNLVHTERILTEMPKPISLNMFILSACFIFCNKYLITNQLCKFFTIFKEYHSFNKYQWYYHTKCFPNYSFQNYTKFFHICWHPQNQYSLHMCKYYFCGCFKYSTWAYLWGGEDLLFLFTHVSNTNVTDLFFLFS